jgi:cytochrome c-type biogenesis protein CcmH/NrfG
VLRANRRPGETWPTADKRIITLDPRNVSSRTRLARYSLAQNDAKTAFDLFKEIVALSPGDADAFKSLYDISLAAGH